MLRHLHLTRMGLGTSCQAFTACLPSLRGETALSDDVLQHYRELLGCNVPFAALGCSCFLQAGGGMEESALEAAQLPSQQLNVLSAHTAWGHMDSACPAAVAVGILGDAVVSVSP